MNTTQRKRYAMFGEQFSESKKQSIITNPFKVSPKAKTLMGQCTGWAQRRKDQSIVELITNANSVWQGKRNAPITYSKGNSILKRDKNGVQTIGKLSTGDMLIKTKLYSLK